MIISLSGAEGAGKSTIAKMLAAKLGWPRYYMGRIWREKAQEKGLTLVEYQKMGETDPSIDREIDEYQKKLGETLDNFVIEGRTSWYFIPHSFKIFLDVSPEEGAKRIFWPEYSFFPPKVELFSIYQRICDFKGPYEMKN